MEPRDDASLKQRLIALPLETPPRDAWASIRTRMEAPPKGHRRLTTPWWMTLAAALAVIALMPAVLHRPDSASADPTDIQLNALMQRSQSLESEIRGIRAASPALADSQFQWERAIENDLAVVDVGLTASGPNPTQLWRERVRLLEELKTASQTDAGPLLLQARLD